LAINEDMGVELEDGGWGDKEIFDLLDDDDDDSDGLFCFCCCFVADVALLTSIAFRRVAFEEETEGEEEDYDEEEEEEEIGIEGNGGWATDELLFEDSIGST